MLEIRFPTGASIAMRVQAVPERLKVGAETLKLGDHRGTNSFGVAFLPPSEAKQVSDSSKKTISATFGSVSGEA